MGVMVQNKVARLCGPLHGVDYLLRWSLKEN